MRTWLLALGLVVLIAGTVLLVVTVVAVPQTWQGEPLVCRNPTTSAQECSDALSLLGLMERLQPFAMLIAGVGAAALVIGLIAKPALPAGGSSLPRP